MRIRKQPRQLPACRDSFLPMFGFAEGVHGWSSRELQHSEVGNGVTTMGEEHHVAKPEPEVVAMSSHGHGQEEEEEQELSLLPPAATSAAGVVTSSPVMDAEVTSNGDYETKMLALQPAARSNLYPESSFTQEDDDEDSLTRRHYVRRGLQRNMGSDGVTLNQCAENIILPIDDPISAIPKANPYEYNDCFPYAPEKERNLISNSRRRTTRYITRSVAMPCNSNEEDDHPSREPEGSLLHSLYMQLLAAGREGISLRSLFTSFESQTSLPRLASNWREQVKAHLKSGPYFEEVKGRYLLCEFLVQQPSRRNTKQKGSSESLQGVQTRRKAYEKTYEAALCESAMEFQKLQYQKAGTSDTPRSESTESDEVAATPISAPFRVKSRKPGSDAVEAARSIRFGGAIPGSLKAMQARIIAESGEPTGGVRCARKDGSNDSSKWQCPMMAMEGHTLCEHHSFLNERKRARYQKARHLGKAKAQEQQQQLPTRIIHHSDKSDSDDLTGLDEVASQALLTMKSDVLAVEPLATNNPVMSEMESSRSASKPAPQFFARSATGRFIAAKKTAVKIPVGSLETDTNLLGKSNNVAATRPPSIPPLPAFYGPRRKSVKNRSLLSIS